MAEATKQSRDLPRPEDVIGHAACAMLRAAGYTIISSKAVNAFLNSFADAKAKAEGRANG